MSALKQKRAKTGARVSVLAILVVAALAVSGIGASSASALACAGANATGQGSSLQAKAQSVWSGVFNTTCAGKNQVTYDSSGSGTGLAAWGYEGGVTNHEYGFIGTDDAPSAAQITNIRKATGNEAGTAVQVIPVAQAAIAIIAHPPANCTVSKITQADLEKVFSGTTTNWNELTNKTEDPTAENPEPCKKHIKRIVRKDASGTTYQLKHLLFLNNSKALDCDSSQTWKELQSAANNTVWPENSAGCESPTLNTIARPTGTGGGELAETVKNDEGTIGYVDLATAEGRTGTAPFAYTILAVQKNKTEFANPYAASGEKANCASAEYTVPAQARETGTGENVDWSGVYGSGTETASYPICTLTWDLAFKDYSEAGFGVGIATTVKEYLREYALEEGTGQTKLEENWYAKLPNAGGAAENVLKAAKFAAGKVQE